MSSACVKRTGLRSSRSRQICNRLMPMKSALQRPEPASRIKWARPLMGSPTHRLLLFLGPDDRGQRLVKPAHLRVADQVSHVLFDLTEYAEPFEESGASSLAETYELCPRIRAVGHA